MSVDSTFSADAETLLGLTQAHWIVPDFQREYVWKDRQVQTLLRDVNDAYTQAEEQYFLGALVWFPLPDTGLRAVIDGQQRMVTLFALAAAIRDRVRHLRLDEGSEEGGELLQELEAFLRDKHVVGGKSRGKRNRLTLSYTHLDQTLDALRQGHGPNLTLPHGDLSRRRMIKAYKLCAAYVEGLEDDEATLQAFFDWLTNALLFVSVRALDITTAYKVFETLNDRGQTLNAADLLKNLLFFEAQGDEDARKEINTHWDRMQDSLLSAPESSKVRFLRYYVAANHASEDDRMVQASDLFDWIKVNSAALGVSKPRRLAEKLAEAADAYSQLARGRRPGGTPSRPLVGILDQGTGVRQHLPPLLAAKSLPPNGLDTLASALEALTLVLAVTRQPWNQVEARLPGWCERLRSVRRSPSDLAQAEVARFVSDELTPWIRSLTDVFWAALRRTDRLRDSLVRYMLVEIEREIRRLAKDKNEVPTDRTIEHIFPQSATEANVEDFFGDGAPQGDEREEALKNVIYALGNLGLLTRNENSVADARIYTEKCHEPYAETAFRITKYLATDMTLGRGAAINDVVAEFGLTSVGVWNAEALNTRTNALHAIMRSRWPLLGGDDNAEWSP